MFVMLAFAFFALAALVIDLGFVRLAQRQMQTAADTAALEGLRWRDDGQSLGIDPHQQASAMAANVFDDDLNPADGDPLNFGAGPVVGFQGGIRPDRSGRQPANRAHQSAGLQTDPLRRHAGAGVE